MRYLHIFTVVGAIIGGFELLSVLTASSITAPQQAAGAAIAAACVVIPYCFARAFVEMEATEASQLKQLNDTIATHTKLLAELANSAVETSQVPEVGL